jgi:hypothetical protein
MGPPYGVLPGVASLELVIARNDRAAVYVGRCSVYPTGFELELRVLAAADAGELDPSLNGIYHRPGRGTNYEDMLRFDLEFDDRRKATNVGGFALRGEGPDGPVLWGVGRGGGGGLAPRLLGVATTAARAPDSGMRVAGSRDQAQPRRGRLSAAAKRLSSSSGTVPRSGVVGQWRHLVLTQRGLTQAPVGRSGRRPRRVQEPGPVRARCSFNEPAATSAAGPARSSTAALRLWPTGAAAPRPDPRWRRSSSDGLAAQGRCSALVTRLNGSRSLALRCRLRVRGYADAAPAGERGAAARVRGRTHLKATADFRLSGSAIRWPSLQRPAASDRGLALVSECTSARFCADACLVGKGSRRGRRRPRSRN